MTDIGMVVNSLLEKGLFEMSVEDPMLAAAGSIGFFSALNQMLQERLNSSDMALSMTRAAEASSVLITFQKH